MPKTVTGTHYQEIVATVLRQSGMHYQEQVTVGKKPDGGRHRVDFVAWRPETPGRKILVSCKVQNWSGSTEEKLPYEVIKLLYTMRENPEYEKAYIILGGTGWSKGIRGFIKKDLREFIPDADRVQVLLTDEFLSQRFR
jgi:hypothetical protein